MEMHENVRLLRFFGVSSKYRSEVNDLISTTARSPSRCKIGHREPGSDERGLCDGNWSGFYQAVEIAAPRYNRTLLLPFAESAPISTTEPEQPS